MALASLLLFISFLFGFLVTRILSHDAQTKCVVRSFFKKIGLDRSEKEGGAIFQLLKNKICLPL